MAWEKIAKEAAESDVVIGSYELVASSSAVPATSELGGGLSRGCSSTGSVGPQACMRMDPNLSRPQHPPPCDVHTSGTHSRSPRRDTSSVRMGRTLGGSSQGACSGGSLAGR